MNLQIKELPKVEVAYVRRIGSYAGPQEHWGKLIGWAIPIGLFPPQQSFIGVSLDNPDLVEGEKCRHDACVTIPKGFAKEQHPEMQFKQIDGGKYVLYSFYDTPEKLNTAYQYMFGQWVPNSDYEVDFERNALEYNLNNPAEDQEGKSRVDLYVPIKE